jgi:mannose-6-phosphate isomerase-like protein (cupin superfamily)/oxalate decarboxylase/phosphoglucose isomerase-like protein (cupin superfamily)
MRKDIKDWARDFEAGRISRRDFVERAAAVGGLGFTTTAKVLAQVQGKSSKAADYNQTNLNPYEEWRKKEGIPVYTDYAVANVRTAPVEPWKRMGVLGAYIDLKGGEGINDGYICEIPSSGHTTPQRYLFEEILYVLSGEGESTIWNAGSGKQSVKWKAGSVFGPPLNTWRQHFNRGRVPARLLAITNAPVVIDLFHDSNFVFNNDYVFRERYQGDPDTFGAGPEKLHHKETTSEESEQRGGVYTWESAYIPDAKTLKVFASRERGESNSRIELQLADNTMQAHISEFEVGTYKKAHRHGPGSHVVMLNGRGYTLMWKGALKYSEAPKETQVRVDWNEGSLFVPPDGWFHQHFNAGGDPARYLAATWGGDGKYFMRALAGGGRTHRLGKTSTRVGGNLIEYEDEDPVIREIFVEELKKSGIPLRMSSKKGKRS